MSINRRSMLLGLAAASTAAATVDASSAQRENPKLIALAAELPAIAAAFHEVNDQYKAAYKEWDARTPWAPDELTLPGAGWPHEVTGQPGRAEMKLLGGFLWRVGDDFPRRIVLESWQVSCQLSTARRAKRRAKKAGSLPDFMAAEAEAERLKALYSTAREYEQKYRDAKERATAWHKKAYPPKEARRNALERHIAAIMSEEDLTMEGLVIKAQALTEWDRIGSRAIDKLALEHGQNWYGQIAKSILRHAAGGAS